MHTISVEIYSENATIGVFYNAGLTQPWNTVHQMIVKCEINELWRLLSSLSYVDYGDQ